MTAAAVELVLDARAELGAGVAERPANVFGTPA
jgi:hypothetical protein